MSKNVRCPSPSVGKVQTETENYLESDHELMGTETEAEIDFSEVEEVEMDNSDEEEETEVGNDNIKDTTYQVHSNLDVKELQEML